MNRSDLQIEDYNYTLPEDRIPKFPLDQRANSKLLVYRNEKISDHQFFELPQFLRPGSQLVFNNTKVIQARILFFKEVATRPIEIFCLEPVDMDVQLAMGKTRSITYHCLVGRAKKWKEGPLAIEMGGLKLQAENLGRENDAFVIRFTWNQDITFAEVLEKAGHTPLPPYLKREDELEDKSRYQTVYAVQSGSVAAPTAGLHFTDEVIESLKSKGHDLTYATLHVGAGTFKPVQASKVEEHEMHFEEVHLTSAFVEGLLQHEGSRTAVGTTSVRTLESLYWIGAKILERLPYDQLNQWDAYDLPQNISVKDALEAILHELNGKDLFFKTQLMIVPGYRFRMVDTIITNFHQPQSTLLLLVAAATQGNWKTLYEHALNNKYRFLSYGDSSIIHV